MILKVLEALEQAVFRQQLFNTLTHYKEVQSMFCAGGRPTDIKYAVFSS
jgi:hypothetical protein